MKKALTLLYGLDGIILLVLCIAQLRAFNLEILYEYRPFILCALIISLINTVAFHVASKEGKEELSYLANKVRELEKQIKS